MISLLYDFLQEKQLEIFFIQSKCYIPNFAKCYFVPISDSTPIPSPTLTFLLPFYYLNSILYSFRDPFSIISLFYSCRFPNSYHMTYSPISVTMLLNPYVSVSRTCTFSKLLYNKLYLVVILQFVN